MALFESWNFELTDDVQRVLAAPEPIVFLQAHGIQMCSAMLGLPTYGITLITNNDIHTFESIINNPSTLQRNNIISTIARSALEYLRAQEGADHDEDLPLHVLPGEEKYYKHGRNQLPGHDLPGEGMIEPERDVFINALDPDFFAVCEEFPDDFNVSAVVVEGEHLRIEMLVSSSVFSSAIDIAEMLMNSMRWHLPNTEDDFGEVFAWIIRDIADTWIQDRYLQFFTRSSGQLGSDDDLDLEDE